MARKPKRKVRTFRAGRKYVRALTALIVLMFLLAPVFAKAEQYVYNQEQLDALLAPIALYPDPLLSQILMASTYPTEVADADRFVRENPNLTGDSLDRALRYRPWDASVKSLCRYPDILATMAGHMDQTVALGDAFLGQRDQVMDTIQRLRQRAYDAGHLRSTAEQRVIVEDRYIVVESVSPRIVYVPVYDPCWVYDPWWWPSCSRVWFWYPGIGISGAFFFGRPVHIGRHGPWSGFHWRRHSIYVDPRRTVEFHKLPPTRAYSGQHVWVHDPSHRRGVAYRGPSAIRGVPRPGPDSRAGYRGFPTDRPGIRAPSGPPAAAPSGRLPGTQPGTRPPRTGAPSVAPEGPVQSPATPPAAAPSGRLPGTQPGTRPPRTGTPSVAPEGPVQSPATPPAPQAPALRSRTSGPPASGDRPSTSPPARSPGVVTPHRARGAAPSGTISGPSGRTGALSAPPIGSPYTRQESERGRSSLRSRPGSGKPEVGSSPTAPRVAPPRRQAPAPAPRAAPAPQAPAPRVAPAPAAPSPAPAPRVAPAPAPRGASPPPSSGRPGGRSQRSR
ncbi:MAG: DUF3300 domain-containing protein [Syntrophorhabdaceae bacterium]